MKFEKVISGDNPIYAFPQRPILDTWSPLTGRGYLRRMTKRYGFNKYPGELGVTTIRAHKQGINSYITDIIIWIWL